MTRSKIMYIAGNFSVVGVLWYETLKEPALSDRNLVLAAALSLGVLNALIWISFKRKAKNLRPGQKELGDREQILSPKTQIVLSTLMVAGLAWQSVSWIVRKDWFSGSLSVLGIPFFVLAIVVAVRN